MGSSTPQLNYYFNITMSWQDYVTTQLVGKNLKCGAIAGIDGNIWAKSPDFNVTPSEIQTLVQNYDTQKYFYLSGNEEVMRGKQGKGGVHVVKTNQTVLVGVYEDPMQPAEAATVTETLGDYLKGAGY